MKLAFVIYKYFPYGGAQRDFLKIAKACLQHGHQVDVYTTAWEGEKISDASIHILPIHGLTNHRRLWNFSKKIRQIVQQTHYDCVMGFNKMPSLDVYFAADICLKAKWKNKFFCWFLSRYRTYLRLEKSVFSKEAKTKILVLTQQQTTEYQNCYHTPENRLIKLPPGVQKNKLTEQAMQTIRNQFRRKLSAGKQIILLFVAANFYNKGLDRAIKAVAACRNLPFQLWVIGGDRQSRYRRLIKTLNIEEKILFLKAQENVFDHLLVADILIHPSRIDSAGMVLVEALTAGLPVLTTDVCGYAFHVDRAKAGSVLSSPFCQAQLNVSLKRLTDINQREIMRQNALRYAKENDLYSLADKAVDIIENHQ